MKLSIDNFKRSIIFKLYSFLNKKNDKLSSVPDIKKLNIYLFWKKIFFLRKITKYTFFHLHKIPKGLYLLFFKGPKSLLKKYHSAENKKNKKIFYPSDNIYKLKNFIKFIITHPIKIPKALYLLFFKGPTVLKNKYLSSQELGKINSNSNIEYHLWLREHYPSSRELKQQKKQQKKFLYRPKISIITPVYNTPSKWLKLCIESVIDQTYDNWELCLADDKSTLPEIKKVLNHYKNIDKRIKVIFRKKNGHICRSSNSALKIATGEYIALLDHDDELTPHALFKVVKLLNKNRKIDFIYSDEDKIETDGQKIDPFFKPDWSPDLFLSIMYSCHLGVYRKKIIDEIDGFIPGYEGAQDWDLVLRVVEKNPNIAHIPDVLYHWRKIPGSTSVAQSGAKSYAYIASKKVLNDYLIRNQIEGEIIEGPFLGSYRIKYKINDPKKVTIIIPTKEKLDYLKKCVTSIIKKTNYKNYEIIIIDTGSKNKKIINYYSKLTSLYNNIKTIYWKKPFNYSSVNNFGVSKSDGDYILLMNNDIEVINNDWLSSMVEHIQRKDVGVVGAKLLFPDNKIQHCGVVLGLGSDRIAGHPFYCHPDSLGYFGMNHLIRNYSAVTGACLLTKKNLYKKVSGLEEKLAICFNDVDYCIKIRELGYKIIYTPYASLYHNESISLGKVNLNKRKIDKKEVLFMKDKWGKLLLNDPFFNKNFSLDRENFSLNLNVSAKKN